MQLGVVLTSAAGITGALWLVWAASALGVVGLAFAHIGRTAPTALHL